MSAAAGADDRRGAFIGQAGDVEEALPRRGGIGADEDGPVDLPGVPPVRGADLDGDVAHLTRRRHVVDQADIQRGLQRRIERRDQVVVVQVEVVGQPEHVGLVVAVDARVAEQEQAGEIMTAHHRPSEGPSARHLLRGELRPHTP
jgi:hypothetical protein